MADIEETESETAGQFIKDTSSALADLYSESRGYNVLRLLLARIVSLNAAMDHSSSSDMIFRERTLAMIEEAERNILEEEQRRTKRHGHR